METSPYNITPDQRRGILTTYGERTDRLVREAERKHITSLSRSRAWELEREGRFPPRRALGPNSCAWLLSELLFWINQQQLVGGRCA